MQAAKMGQEVPLVHVSLLPLLILRALVLLILLLSICPRCWPAWLPPLVLLRLVELGARGRFLIRWSVHLSSIFT